MELIPVVGAGPAGLTAAITLAREGYPVVVYEDRSDVGHRFHGDFQGLENWTTEEDVTHVLARMGIKINFLCEPYFVGEVFDPDLRKVTVRSKAPVFYLVRRGSGPGTLDQGLKAQALDAGVEILFGKRVEQLPKGGIIAIGPKVADVIAKGVLFETDLPDLAAGIVDDRLAPKGYAYLLVHKGQATLATVMFRHYRDERQYFLRTVEAFQRLYPLEMRAPREFGGYGNFSIRPTERRGQKLYVGEAAGFQDALFGFGMRYAILSGYLTARSIIDGKDYDPLWMREFRPLLRAAMVNRLLYELCGNRGYAWMLRRLARVPDVRGWMRRAYRPSLGKSLLYPLASLVGRYRMRFKDYSCSHEDCACVWCRCQQEEGCL